MNGQYSKNFFPLLFWNEYIQKISQWHPQNVKKKSLTWSQKLCMRQRKLVFIFFISLKVVENLTTQVIT